MLPQDEVLLLKADELKLEPYRGELAGVDGWLSPSGVFYACNHYDHIIIADLLTAKYSYQNNNIPSELNGELTLEEHGWVKISLARLVFYKDLLLTKKQVDFLFDYYIINGRETEFQEILMIYKKASNNI